MTPYYSFCFPLQIIRNTLFELQTTFTSCFTREGHVKNTNLARMTDDPNTRKRARPSNRRGRAQEQGQNSSSEDAHSDQRPSLRVPCFGGEPSTSSSSPPPGQISSSPPHQTKAGGPQPTYLTKPAIPIPGMGNQGIRQHVETSTKTGVFHMSKAKLHEFPPELAKITNALRNIDLSENKIAIIPQNISAFVNLKHLNLSFNQIEVVPDQIGQLAKLETLSLANNRIKAVPSTIAQLQKLRDANLGSNALTSFPTVFSSLKFLTVLDLSRNRIPAVPDGVGDLQVVELILNQNQVRSISKDLAKCTNLKTLRLQENTLELSGIPTEILSDSQVSLLSVEGNLFDVKQLSDLDGYDNYMERYTTTKKKLT
ncbi:Leucine-rich repeat-containing protein 57 [Orchesella cincta]|uniref:Leucine-rich repeat-containing protein 57 n=1 Tax=Orchesella cincta TaxID=48709 RepID=A0A1D2N158_ORCCI|nr:Leucine-rich repeat-containing protein 57 [Orchesella cincta]